MSARSILSAPKLWAPSTRENTPRSRAAAHSSLAGMVSPVVLETCVKDMTLVAGVYARLKASMISSSPPGITGTDT